MPTTLHTCLHCDKPFWGHHARLYCNDGCSDVMLRRRKALWHYLANVCRCTSYRPVQLNGALTDQRERCAACLEPFTRGRHNVPLITPVENSYGELALICKACRPAIKAYRASKIKGLALFMARIRAAEAANTGDSPIEYTLQDFLNMSRTKEAAQGAPDPVDKALYADDELLANSWASKDRERAQIRINRRLAAEPGLTRPPSSETVEPSPNEALDADDRVEESRSEAT